MVSYSTDKNIDLDQLITLYKNSFTEIPRPVDSKSKIQDLLTHSNLIISAWNDKNLIGICRGFTDFNFVTYISDLAVARPYQKKGIGKELLNQAKLYSKDSKRLVLLSSVAANSYYKKIGFESHERAWLLKYD